VLATDLEAQKARDFGEASKILQIALDRKILFDWTNSLESIPCQDGAATSG
jgi:hypothetical protein